MAFKGDLKNVQLADLFQTLSQNRQQGVLTLSSRGTVHRVRFSREGVTLLDPSVASRRRLGDILVSAGLVTEKELGEALRDQAKTRRLLGDILVEKGKVDRDDLHAILQLQIEEEIYDLFRMEGGLFEFSEGEGPRSELPVSSFRPLAVDHVVLEAARRLDEWGIIHQQIPSLDGIYVSLVDPTALPGDEEAALVLARLDGRRDVRDAADSLLSSPFTVSKVLARLLAAGHARAATPPELLESAKALLAESNRTRALKLLHRLAEFAQQAPALDVELADLFRIAGDARAAAQARLRLAQFARGEKRLDEARRQLEFALREWPGAAPVLEPLVEVVRELGDTEAELHHVRELADVQTESGAHEAALKAMERVLELAPGDPDARRRLSDLCLRARLKEKAVEVLEQDVQRWKKEGNAAEVAVAYKRILAIDAGRKDVKRALARLKRTRADKLLRFGLLGTVVLGIGVMGLFALLRSHDRKSGLEAVDAAHAIFRRGDAAGARAAVEEAVSEFPRPEVVQAAMRLLDQIDERVADSTLTRRGEREDELARQLEAIQDQAGRLNFDTSFADCLALLRREPEVYLQGRLKARLEVVQRAFLDLIARAKERAASYREPEHDEEVAAAWRRMSDVFPVEFTTALPNVRNIAFEAAKELEDQPREWMHQVLAGVDEYELLQARMKPAIETLRQRHVRLTTLQQLSSDYLAAVRAAEAGNIERSRTLLRKVLDEYGQGELHGVLEERLKRLDEAATAVQDIERHLADGEMDAAHVLALKTAREYRDLQIPATLGVPVELDSLPSGAAVTIDGKELGVTPVLLRLPIGTKGAVRVALERFEPTDLLVDPVASPRARVELRRARRATLALGGAALSRPLWHEQRLFVAGRDGTLHAISFDAAGKPSTQRWKSGSISGSLAEPVGVPGGVLFTVFEGRVCRVGAAATGLTVNWSRELEDELRDPPVVVGDEAWVATGAGRLAALALADGAVRARLEFGGRRLAGAIATGAGLVFVPLAGGVIAAVTPADRTTAWERPLGEDLVGGLVAGDKLLLAMTATGRLVLLDPATGTPRRTIELGDLPVDRPRFAAGSQVDVALGKSLVRIDVERGEIVARWSCDPAPVATPLDCNGTLWTSSDKAMLLAFDVGRQTLLHRTQLAVAALVGAPVATDFGLALLARDGTVTLVEP